MAKIYEFRLEPVLRHRRRTEDAAALELAAAQQRADRIAERLIAIHDETLESRLCLLAAAGRGSNGVELRRLADNVDCLRARATAVAERLATERQREEQARVRLVKAAQDRRALELLAEKQRSALEREEQRRERREADDIASGIHRWRRLQAADAPTGR